MGRRTPRPNKFYCPKCSKKQLERGYENGFFVWKCKYNAPSTKPWRRGAKVLKEDQIPCGLVITHPHRHAEISDYKADILDRMAAAKPGDVLKSHLLATIPSIQRRGLEVLFAGELVELVRLNDDEGIGAYIYIKENWENGGAEKTLALTSRAARLIKFRDVDLYTIAHGRRFCLWALKETYYSQRHAPYKGKLTAKMKRDLVAWAAALDHDLPELKSRAIVDDRRWTAEERILRQEIAELRDDVKGPYVQIEGYDGAVQKATIKVHGHLSADQVRAIADIVAPKVAN